MKQTLIRRFTKDKVKMINDKIKILFMRKIRNRKINNNDFSIISNNCWAGYVYRYFGLPYSSPTIGLYFFPDDYLDFLENLEESIKSDIKIIKTSESKNYDELIKKGQGDVIVGLLSNDIEIIFLHYDSPKEAIFKWNKRCKRINNKNLIIKFSEMNGCNEKHIKRFNNLEFDKKVLFLANKYKEVDSIGIIIDRYTNGNEIVNDTIYYDEFIDLFELINKGHSEGVHSQGNGKCK